MDLPSIIEEPKKGIDFKLGEVVKIAISARPAGNLFYEWIKDNGELPPEERCSGARTPELTIFHAREEDAGKYYCRVSNSVGCVTSKKAKLELRECQYMYWYIIITSIWSMWLPVWITLAIVKIPVIIQQPKHLTVARNGKAEFVIKAKGRELTFSWKKDGVALSEDLSG